MCATQYPVGETRLTQRRFGVSSNVIVARQSGKWPDPSTNSAATSEKTSWVSKQVHTPAENMHITADSAWKLTLEKLTIEISDIIAKSGWWLDSIAHMHCAAVFAIRMTIQQPDDKLTRVGSGLSIHY
jgi:hypothetical protein